MGLTSDQILEKCRVDFKDNDVRPSDVYNAVFRDRGDDLKKAHKLIMEEVCHQEIVSIKLVILYFNSTTRASWICSRQTRRGSRAK